MTDIINTQALIIFSFSLFFFVNHGFSFRNLFHCNHPSLINACSQNNLLERKTNLTCLYYLYTNTIETMVKRKKFNYFTENSSLRINIKVITSLKMLIGDRGKMYSSTSFALQILDFLNLTSHNFISCTEKKNRNILHFWNS